MVKAFKIHHEEINAHCETINLHALYILKLLDRGCVEELAPTL